MLIFFFLAGMSNIVQTYVLSSADNCFVVQCNVAGGCFLGSSVIDWLLKWHFADSRDAACRLAEKLLYHAHILPLLPGRDKKTAETTTPASTSFCDSSDTYYRFVCISDIHCLKKTVPTYLLFLVCQISTDFNNKNTFYGTRYLSHCCSLYCCRDIKPHIYPGCKLDLEGYMTSSVT